MSELPLPVIEHEARRLVARIRAGGLPLRLVGGMAIRMRVGEKVVQRLPRTIGDLDFVAARKSHREASAFFAESGYEAEERFNAINREQRLLFHDRGNARQIDVFVGSFEMCHRVPFDARLLVDDATLPLAELLVTKLQVVEINAKDLEDVMLLLAAYPVGDADGEIFTLHASPSCVATTGGSGERSRPTSRRWPPRRSGSLMQL